MTKGKSTTPPPCYMCAEPGTTKEHVPARAFFPKGYRKNLWTVPSCPTHNKDNDLDVEYVSTCIVSAIEAIGDALQENQTKVFRALEKSAGLQKATVLKDIMPIRLSDGELSATFKVDLNRFDSMMKATAYAVYRHLQKTNYSGKWVVVNPAFDALDTLYAGKSDKRKSILEALAQMSFTNVPTPEPDVFQCEVKTFEDGSTVYKFVFYIGFRVYVVDKLIYEVISYGRS